MIAGISTGSGEVQGIAMIITMVLTLSCLSRWCCCPSPGTCSKTLRETGNNVAETPCICYEDAIGDDGTVTRIPKPITRADGSIVTFGDAHDMMRASAKQYPRGYKVGEYIVTALATNVLGPAILIPKLAVKAAAKAEDFSDDPDLLTAASRNKAKNLAEAGRDLTEAIVDIAA